MSCIICKGSEYDLRGEPGNKTIVCVHCGHLASYGIGINQITHLDGIRLTTIVSQTLSRGANETQEHLNHLAAQAASIDYPSPNFRFNPKTDITDGGIHRIV